ncbi:MAG: hypothetical protein EKK55_02180 [Rhodocyclaceae bacterium]|nr:MAG: hypothetical protein EKK55_02180 [Rhodocyclaceae bacterium]
MVAVPGGVQIDLEDILRSVHAEHTQAEALALKKSDWGGRVLIDGVPFVWSETSTRNDASNLIYLRPTLLTSGDAGRFIVDTRSLNLRIPVTAAQADAATIFTVPTGCAFKVVDPGFWWDITTTSFTGGSSASMGISSNKTGFTGKGSLLGGTGGDVLATLATSASPTLGTRGFRTFPAGSRIVTETLAVASAAATPSYTIDQLLAVKTVGTGAPAPKLPGINGDTPDAGEAAPNAGGTSIVFHAETTGTGTAVVSYLTSNAVALENTLWVAGDTFRKDEITSDFTAGSGYVGVAVRIIRL